MKVVILWTVVLALVFGLATQTLMGALIGGGMGLFFGILIYFGGGGGGGDYDYIANDFGGGFE